MPIPAHHIGYAPFAYQISSATHPKTMDDLNTFHKDSMYELVSAVRDAYIMKTLASKLASNVTKSSNVRDMANLIADTAREQERALRMAACIANAPVSTTHPYLPVMPTKVSAPLAQAGPTASVPSKTPTQPAGSVPLPPPLKQGFGSVETSFLPHNAFSTSPTSSVRPWANFI